MKLFEPLTPRDAGHRTLSGIQINRINSGVHRMRLALLLAMLGPSLLMLSGSLRGQPAGDEAYQAILKREFGTAVREMEAIEKEIQDAKPEKYPEIEARLLAVVESSEATMPGKQFACQMLRIVGSPKCIPAVSKLLTDEKLSHIARNILLGMHGQAAEESLRKALSQTDGKLRIGLINTIGDRRDQSSLDALAGLLKSSDEVTSQAVLNAVGKLGGQRAADVLDRVKAAGPLQAAWADAYLRCAASLGTADRERAEKMYRSLFEGDLPLPIRAAALPALARTQKDRAVPLIVKALFSDEAILRRAAASSAITVPGNAATRGLAGALSGLSPENQAALIQVLAIRGDAEEISDGINKLAGDGDAIVRQAALGALARLGNVQSIPVLTKAVKEGGSVGTEASKSLVEIQGPGVVAALIQQSEAGDATIRSATFKVLADRGEAEALPVFRKTLNDQDATLRRAAVRALAALGTQEDLSRLVNMFVAENNSPERGSLGTAISEIGARIPDPTARSEAVLQTMGGADPAAKAALLQVLSTLGGEKALQAVRAA